MPFIVDKLCKHSRCPSTEEWKMKLWYRLIMEHFSCIKKGEKWIISRDMDGSRACYTE